MHPMCIIIITSFILIHRIQELNLERPQYLDMQNIPTEKAVTRQKETNRVVSPFQG